MRRPAIAIIVTIGALLLGSTPAAAGQHSNEFVNGASADWSWSEGDISTSVHLQVAEDRQQAPGGAVRSSGINVQVFRVYPGAADGSMVSELLVTDPYYAPASSLDLRELSSASVVADVTLTGTRWTETGEESVGPLAVRLTADWVASGEVTRSRASTWSTEFDSWLLERTATRTAPAVAIASLSGDLAYGDLGEAEGQFMLLRGSWQVAGREAAAGLAAMSLLTAGEAANRQTSHVLRAFAGWTMDDLLGSQVLLTVEQPRSANGRPGRATAFVEVDQSFCDVSTDEAVNRLLFADSTPLTSGGVDSALGIARAVVTFSLRGAEIRSPGCGTPRDGETTVTDIGPMAATIEASWTGYGGLSHYRIQSSSRSLGSWTHVARFSRGRLATASGTISGDLFSGPLTNLVNAFLEDDRETSASSGSGAA